MIGNEDVPGIVHRDAHCIGAPVVERVEQRSVRTEFSDVALHCITFKDVALTVNGNAQRVGKARSPLFLIRAVAIHAEKVLVVVGNVDGAVSIDGHARGIRNICNRGLIRAVGSHLDNPAVELISNVDVALTINRYAPRIIEI